MKKYLLVLVCILATSTLYAQKGEKTLYIVDGKATSKEAVEAISPDQIQNIDIFKDIEGAVVVTTKAAKADENTLKVISIRDKKGVETRGEVTTVHYDKQSGKATIEETSSKRVIIGSVDEGEAKISAVADPLILLKEKNGSFKALANDALSKIDPNTIQAITVLKDKTAEAYAQYGEVKNGVIVVELK